MLSEYAARARHFRRCASRRRCLAVGFGTGVMVSEVLPDIVDILREFLLGWILADNAETLDLDRQGAG